MKPATFLLPIALLACATAYGQQPQPEQSNVPTRSTNTPVIPDAPPISGYTPNVPTQASGTPFTEPRRSAPTGLDAAHFFGPYHRAKVPELFPGSGERLRSLVRDGKLYLTAKDAIALAIENNLDVEVERYNLILADTDRLRAAGGGNLRGIDYTVQEPPNGVGGPGSPLIASTATNPNPVTPSVTDLTSLNATTQATTNLLASTPATTQYSAGPTVPLFDPTLFGEASYLRRSDTVSLNSALTGGSTRTTGTTTTSTAPHDFITADISYLEGFRYGTQLEATVNNDSSVIYGSKSQLDPFSRPSASVTVTQPLLRGAGSKVNLRFIHIANEDKKISRLLFEQQVLETVYGASRIYFDLVSLGENVAVKQDALNAAKKAPVRRQSPGRRRHPRPHRTPPRRRPRQLERVRPHPGPGPLSHAGSHPPQPPHPHRVPPPSPQASPRSSPPIASPSPTPSTPYSPSATSSSKASPAAPTSPSPNSRSRTGQISAAASRNEALPQLNFYANYEKRGSSEQAYEPLGTPGTAIPTLPQNFALGGLSVSTIVQGGVQLNLPIRNRTAQADAARDTIQVRQVQARTEKLSNSIRQDIETAEIAVETSFAAYKAAKSSRGYQEQLLQADRDRLEFGESTNLQVVQDVAYLAQARESEIAARSNYQKARIELDRSLGDLLDKNGISLDDAVQGQLKP